MSGKSEDGAARFSAFLKACDRLSADVKDLNARIDDLDKRLEELNGLVAGLYEIGEAIAKMQLAKNNGDDPSWAKVIAKGLDILGGGK